MDKYTLYVFPKNDLIKNNYIERHNENGRFELINPEIIHFRGNEIKTIDFKIKCKMFSPERKTCNFIVAPLPQIAFTPLISPGIMVYSGVSIDDPDFSVKIPIKNLSSDSYSLEPDNYILQVLAPNYAPLDIVISDLPVKTNKTRSLRSDLI